MSDTRGERERHQGVNVGDTLKVNVGDTLSRSSIKKIPQEKESRKNLQGNVSGAERPLPTNGAQPFRRHHPQNELGLLTVIEGRKDARQESAADIEPPGADTPDERRATIAELEELLAPMKATDAGYTTLAAYRDEHLAALGADTERRATA